MSNGDWYCRSCGYIVAQRVTSSETCDTCHQPVEWHDAEQRGAVEQIQQQLAAAQAEARNWKRIAEDALSQAAEQPAKRDPAELVRLFNSNDWPRPGAERESLPLALEANRSGAVSERIEDYRPAAQESE